MLRSIAALALRCVSKHEAAGVAGSELETGALLDMTFAAPAQPSALAAKGPAARVRGHLRGRIIIGVLPIATAAGLLIVWEAIVRGLKISPVILPSPSQVYQKVITVLPLLVDNSVQTGGEAVLGLVLAAA